MKGSPSSKLCNTSFYLKWFLVQVTHWLGRPYAESGTGPIHSHNGILVFCPCQNFLQLEENRIDEWLQLGFPLQEAFMVLSCVLVPFSYSTVVDQRHGFLFVFFIALASSVWDVVRAWIAGPMDCPAISTPCSLVSRAASLSHDSCSICPSCINLWFISCICCSVAIGHASQGPLLPAPQLHYHFDHIYIYTYINI